MIEVDKEGRVDELLKQAVNRPVPNGQRVRAAVWQMVEREIQGRGEIMTLAEVASFLRLSEKEMAEVAEELPAFELAGKVLVRRERLMTWISEREGKYAWAVTGGAKRRGYAVQVMKGVA